MGKQRSFRAVLLRQSSPLTPCRFRASFPRFEQIPGSGCGCLCDELEREEWPLNARSLVRTLARVSFTAPPWNYARRMSSVDELRVRRQRRKRITEAAHVGEKCDRCFLGALRKLSRGIDGISFPHRSEDPAPPASWRSPTTLSIRMRLVWLRQ